MGGPLLTLVLMFYGLLVIGGMLAAIIALVRLGWTLDRISLAVVSCAAAYIVARMIW